MASDPQTGHPMAGYERGDYFCEVTGNGSGGAVAGQFLLDRIGAFGLD